MRVVVARAIFRLRVPLAMLEPAPAPLQILGLPRILECLTRIAVSPARPPITPASLRASGAGLAASGRLPLCFSGEARLLGRRPEPASGEILQLRVRVFPRMRWNVGNSSSRSAARKAVGRPPAMIVQYA